jgi:hypothetical protein
VKTPLLKLVMAGLCVAMGCASQRGEAPQGKAPQPSTTQSEALQGRFGAQLHQLETADVAHDVAESIAHGDLRPVGVMGIGPIVPGFDDPSIREHLEAPRYIPNTSDVIQSAQHMELQEAAYDYAERYNRMLQARLRNTSTQPSK